MSTSLNWVPNVGTRLAGESRVKTTEIKKLVNRQDIAALGNNLDLEAVQMVTTDELNAVFESINLSTFDEVFRLFQSKPEILAAVSECISDTHLDEAAKHISPELRMMGQQFWSEATPYLNSCYPFSHAEEHAALVTTKHLSSDSLPQQPVAISVSHERSVSADSITSLMSIPSCNSNEFNNIPQHFSTS